MRKRKGEGGRGRERGLKDTLSVCKDQALIFESYD